MSLRTRICGGSGAELLAQHMSKQIVHVDRKVMMALLEKQDQSITYGYSHLN
jgi:hypothetical protein